MSENMQESVEPRNTTQECLGVIEAMALASESLTGMEGMWGRGDTRGTIEIIRIKVENRTLPCMPLTAAARVWGLALQSSTLCKDVGKDEAYMSSRG